jgi:DNA-binding beta-propeller fold protein YncE
MKNGFVRWALPLLLFAICFFFSAGTARADGGAPNLAYVAGTAHNISVIDIAQQKIVTTLSVDGTPDTILLSVDGRLLFVTQPGLNRLTVLAPKTKQVVCTQQIAGRPSLLALDPGTNILYVAGNEGRTVVGLDPTTCRVTRTLQVQSGVSGLAVAVVGSGLSGGSGNQIWIAQAQGLAVFDANGHALANVPLQGGPRYLCIPAGPTAYVTTQKGEIEAVDLKSRRVLPPLLTEGQFGPMDYDAATGQVYVPDQAQKRIDVLSPVSAGAAAPAHQPVRTFAFNAAPQSIAITSDGQLGFVALANGSVAMLDLLGHQVIKTFQVGGAPRFIITGLYPSLFSLTPQQSSVLIWLAGSIHYIAVGVVVIVTIVLILMPKPQRPVSSSEK